MSRAPLVSLFVQSLAIASLLIFTAPTVSAQGVPWYTIPLPIPNGFVDVATGNVHLEIPLASIPERNGDPLVAKVIWDSSSWTWAGEGNAFGLAGPGWLVFTGNSHVGQGSVSTTSSSCSEYNPYTEGSVYYYHFSFTDANSTPHSTGSEEYTMQVECKNPTTNQYFGSGNDIVSLTAPASDSSGYTFKASNYTTLQVIAPDGTIVAGGYASGPAPIDTNGNYSSIGTSTLQPDMLKRVPFQVSPNRIAYNICSLTTITFEVLTSNGSTNNYTFTCSQLSVAQIDISGVQHTATESFLSTISLPDNTQYSFTYDNGTTGNHYGTLTGITLPTGGAVSFSVPGTSRTVSYGGNTWTISSAVNTPSYGQSTITVLSPPRYDSASKTNISDQAVFVTVPAFLPYVETAKYYSGSSTLLRTVSTTYSTDGNYIPLTVTTSLNDSGQSSSISYQYFQYLSAPLRNSPTQKQETDFTGAIARTTVTQYNGPYNKPSSVNVYSG
jgi:hypothetical protein